MKEIEQTLLAEGFVPKTVGRNTFGASPPLRTITELMNRCCGTVIIALERIHFASGTEWAGGPDARTHLDIRLPSVWNQIEAGMAQSRDLPLLVIVEDGLRSEGLLEKGNDWYVQWVSPTAAALGTPQFRGVLADWKAKVIARSKKPAEQLPDNFTLSDLLRFLKGMKVSHLWAFLTALAAVLAGAFAIGARFGAIGTK